MKIVYYGIFIAIFVLGSALYLITDHRPPRFITAESTSIRSESTQDPKSISTVTQDATAAHRNTDDFTRPTAAPEKKCTCCSETSLRIKEIVKQKRKDLELWARDTIANYGYKDGMKRITAKSPALAQRIQRILEQEQKLSQTSAASQLSTR